MESCAFMPKQAQPALWLIRSKGGQNEYWKTTHVKRAGWWRPNGKLRTDPCRQGKDLCRRFHFFSVASTRSRIFGRGIQSKECASRLLGLNSRENYPTHLHSHSPYPKNRPRSAFLPSTNTTTRHIVL